MKLSDIGVGFPIEVFLKRDGYNYRIVTKVSYVRDNCIGIDPIASSQKLFRFRDTDEVDIVFREESKYWKWEKVKAGIATLEDGVQMHVFSVRGIAQEYNRRSQYRLPMDREITINVEVEDESFEETNYSNMTPDLEIEQALEKISERYKEVEYKAHLRDLSEGGASFDSDVELEKGAFVSFTLESELGPIYCRGVIIRARKDARGFYDYSYGCSFAETSKNYIKFFYEEQRRQLYEHNENKPEL